MQNIDFQKIVYELIKTDKRPIPKSILSRKVETKVKRRCFKDIDVAINELIKAKKIAYNKFNKLYVPFDRTKDLVLDTKTSYVGTIALNAKNNGFITKEGDDKALYYVDSKDLKGALNGDKVEFFMYLGKTLDGKRNLIDSVVSNVLDRNKKFYVGSVKNDNGITKLITDDLKMYKEAILVESPVKLVDGTKILFEIVNSNEKAIFGKLTKIIGHENDVGTDILSIVYDNGIKPDFDDEIIELTNKLSFHIDEKQKRLRKDITNLDIITIDPESSKDFDDAVFVEKISGDKYFLSVSIADVSHYVQYKTKLDDAAVDRATSVYLVDRVIPMLPHILSNDICSINPNVERFAITCDMTIDKDGNFDDIKVYPSIMKSKRRFSYDEVNLFYSNKSKLENDRKEIIDMLITSRELYRVLKKKVESRGYISFDVPEPKIIVNEKCEPIEISIKKTGTAQKMIEQFMIAANEAVTLYAEKHKVPFIYRVHDKPALDRLQKFSIEAKKLNFKITEDFDDIESKTISKWISNNASNENMDLVSVLLLRTMAKAKYATKNIYHFGLASKNYTHFTSPIRRYPDLIVHRLLWMYLFDKESYTDEQRNSFVDSLSELCDICSSKEANAVKTERDVNSLKFTEFMKRHVGDEFDGKVMAVVPFGFFVELPNTIEGMVKLENIKLDTFVYNEKNITLVGMRTKKVVTLGTKVRIKVVGADTHSRRIDFEIAKFY